MVQSGKKILLMDCDSANPSQHAFFQIDNWGLSEPDTLDSNKLVSVIIPVFNVRPYLVEALDSVLRQTYTKLEIIIIDDGSTDGSGKICDEYAERDARVLVIHQENKGLSTARNVGLDRMSGEAVVFLDPDDAYHPDFVKDMMDAMIREKANQVICRYTTHYTTGKMRCTGGEKLNPSIASGMYDSVSLMRAFADGKINAAVWNKLYKSELWDHIRFLDGHVYESEDVACRINGLSKRTYVLDTSLYLYRQRLGSITTTLSWNNASDSLLCRSHTEAFMAEHTPAIFSYEQLNSQREKRLIAMIVCYILSLNEIDKKTFGDGLKNQILKIGREIGIANCNFRTKMAYWMMLYCPWLAKMVFPFYYPVRLLVRKVAGKCLKGTP